MKAYNEYIFVYAMDGEEIDGHVSKPILLEEEPEDKEDYLDWQNIEMQIFRHDLHMRIYSNGRLYIGDHCISKRKKDYDTFKLKLVVHYSEAKMSIKDLMNYYDADAAIKYMVERGLTITTQGKKKYGY